MATLIKAVLALEQDIIPPTAGLKKPQSGSTFVLCSHFCQPLSQIVLRSDDIPSP